MKKTIFTISILFFTSFSLEKFSYETMYKCLDSGINSNFCRYEEYETQITYLRNCPTGYKCSLGIRQNTSNRVTACEQKLQYKKEGSSCLLHEECETNYCKNNKCSTKEIGQDCDSDLECAKDSFCYNQQCKPSGKKGDKCDSYKGCLAGYYCGTNDKWASETFCIEEYSVPNGKYAAHPKLCESGKLDQFRNLCYDTQSNVPEGTICEDDSNCTATKIMGDVNQETTLSCSSTWDGKKICDYGTKSERWTSYVSYYRTEMQKKKVSYSRVIGKENEFTPYDDLNINNYYFKTNPLFYNAPSCLLDAINLPSGTENSNSEWIKFSFVFLFDVFLLL